MENLYILISLLSILSSCASETLRPRGVSLEKAPFYAPAKSFRCLDGSGTIPYTQINDDYCDCRDGSDEPGTSACPNGIFHCNNAGYIPVDLRSSRVNDGYCDCCDTSDEWNSGAQCVDVCHEFGRQEREEALKREEERKKGVQAKLNLIEEGKKIRQEKENKIAELKQEISVAEGEKAELDAAKKAAEEPEARALEQYREAEEARKEAERKIKEESSQTEAREVFDSLDANNDGEVSTGELQADTTYDTNRDGTVSEDEAGFYLQQSESVDFEKFYSSSWRLMRPAYRYAQKKNDVKEPQASPEPLFRPPEPTTAPTPVEEEMVPPPPTEAPQPDEEEYNPEAEGLDEYDEKEDLDEEEDYPDTEEVPEDTKEEDSTPPEVVYDEETQALVDAANAARSAYQEAERNVKDLNSQLIDEEESYNKDFGSEDQFRVLEKKCFEYTDREYTYKLCLFDKTTQSSKNGGSLVTLGTWGEWVASEDGTNSYSTMMYSNGQQCWNGPKRSTKVHLVCGVENELKGAVEPSKCEYEFTFATPAACVSEEDDDAASHDEL